MQVRHAHNRVIKLREARREGYERITSGVGVRRRGYRGVVGVGCHDRRINREHLRTFEFILIRKEDAIFARFLQVSSGRSLRGRYVVGLAVRGGGYQYTVS